MNGSCEFIPKVKHEGQMKDSQLFPELVAFTGNRETAKYVYSVASIDELMGEVKGIQRNAVGEPTLESLDKMLGLRDYLKDGISTKFAKKELGAINAKGEPILHDSLTTIYNKVVDFNEKNPKLVATIEEVNGKYRINVDKKNLDNQDEDRKLVFNVSLNNRLLDILKSLGFDVEIVNKSRYNAIFSPQRATTNAEGLLTVIQLLKGEAGEAAFPEEFSHLIIEGLMNNQLVSRLVNSLDSIDILKEILGDSFQSYVDKYNGDMMMLQKEAAAKLLSKGFNKENVSHKQNLVERIINFVERLFERISGEVVNSAIVKASEDADLIASKILNNELTDSIDKDAIISAKTMYSVERELKGIEDLAERSLELMSRRYHIMQSRRRGKFDHNDYVKLKALQEDLEEGRYGAACAAFMRTCFDEINHLNDKIKSLSSLVNTDDLSTLKEVSSTLREIKDFINGYGSIVKQLKLLNNKQDIEEFKVSPKLLERITSLATSTDTMIDQINENYNNLRYSVVYNFLKTFYGEDKLIEAGKDKDKTLTLKMIMDTAGRDIGILDTYVNAMSDSQDPMLSLIDKVVKNTQNKRDNKLNEILANVRAAHAKLEKAGYKTDFMYERDKEGNLTGRIISDIDFERYNADRRAKIKELKEKYKNDYHRVRSELDIWESENTSPQIVNDNGKVEILPNEKYKKPMSETLEYTLSKEQKEYYDFMIQLKSIFDSMLPDKYTNLYKAIQIKDDTLEAISKSVKDPKKAGKILKEKLKDSFLRRDDDIEFGDTSEGKKVELDFLGNPIEKLPVYYTKPLGDMSRLSTDFTSSILSYASAAINYEEMSKVIDALELTRDYVKEQREVTQHSGDSKIYSTITELKKTFSKIYVKPGAKTNIGKRIDAYFKNAIYEERKEDEGTINFLGKKIDIAKLVDSIKNYSGTLGLGLNLFSGLSNVTMGKMQMFLEAMGRESYNLKDSVRGMRQYWELMPKFLEELNAVNKTNKMSLLIDKFDALEEFYNNLRNKGYYNGALSRIIGSSNLLFLNNMGEHYLHTRNMLSVLNTTKVKKNGKEVSLYDALITEEKEGVTQLVFDEGVTDLEGNLLSTKGLDESSEEYNEVYNRSIKYISTQKNKIGKVNQALNGAFNENDKGEIQRHSMGRLLMQFRQWMPAHYGRRFAKAHYDFRLDQTREGYYRTFLRFTLDTIKDLSRAKFEIGTKFDALSPMEKANMRKALTELVAFVLLGVLISAIGPEKDKKGKWGERMVIYQLKRLKLETGASIPWISIIDNFFQIAQKPAAALTTVENIIDVFKIWNMNKEIQRGRYKGYSQWGKDVSELLPVYGQIKKAVHLKDDDYLFNIFNY